MASTPKKRAAAKPAEEQPIVEQPIAEQPAVEQPADEAPAAVSVAEAATEPSAEAPQAEQPEAHAEEQPGQSVEDACAELGLSIEADGHCPVEIIESVSGGLNLSRGDPHRFEAAEAVRAVRAGIAKARG